MNTPNVQNNNKTLFFNPKSFTYTLYFSSVNQTITLSNAYYTTQGITMDKVQSVYVDNSNSNGTTFINISNTSQNIIVEAGAIGFYPLFLNNNSIITINNNTTTTSTVTLIFTEKTLQPAILSSSDNALLTLFENLENQTGNYLATKDININSTFNSNINAITIIQGGSANVYTATIASGSTSASISISANTIIRKIKIVITSNATLSTAGIETISFSETSNAQFANLNTGVYLPATISTTPQPYIVEYDDLILSVTGGDTLTITLGTALATGTVYIYVY